MDRITSYTEDIIKSFLSFSNKQIDVQDYLLFRQQAINEVTDLRFNYPVSSAKENSNRSSSVQEKIDKPNITNNVCNTQKETICNVNNTINNKKIEEIESNTKSDDSNFWDIINRIED